MKRIIITLTNIMLVVLAFGQTIYKNGEIRLSPRLLNYQGFLTDTLGNPITNPSVSMTFALFDAASSGNQKWTETQSTVNVSKGIFHVLLGSVTPIPDSVFNNTGRWLELSVSGQTLAPRTRIVSVPFAYSSTLSDTAIYARSSAPDNKWTYLISDVADTTLQTGGLWGLARTGNILFGNADSTHVNFGIACTTGESGQNNKYCTISGGHNNLAKVGEATVGGGSSNWAMGYQSFIGGGGNNRAGGSHNTIAGGRFNHTDQNGSTVGGGCFNVADDLWTFGYATVSGGYKNTAYGSYATVGGGMNNYAFEYATVSGGERNGANADNSTLSGGGFNAVNGIYSVIPGGYADTIAVAGDYSYLFGINSNLTQDSTLMVDMPHVWFGTEAAGYEFPRQRGVNGQVLGTNASGQLNWYPGFSDWTFLISDGADTTLQMRGRWGLARAGNVLHGNADSTHVNFGGACTTGTSGQNYKYSTISGGQYNKASRDYATVSGGYINTAVATYATVGGGCYNSTASGVNATVSGGGYNTAGSVYTTVGGGYSNYASSGYATAAGGMYDTTAGVYGAILGGYSNHAGYNSNDTASVVVGGHNNYASAKFAFIGGGRDNVAGNYYSTVCGGRADTVIGQYATVGGGNVNVAGATYATVGGGNHNNADGTYTFVGGGNWNVASGVCATVAGGSVDSATANYSFATGYSAKVDASDTNSAAFTTSHTTAKNQVRAAAFSTGVLDFAMDHPDDPMNKILNQYGVSSDEVQSQYSGSVILDHDGRAAVNLPDYFNDINRDPRIQLTGVGSSDVYVAEKIKNNCFVVGGKPGIEVYWEVTGERTDIHAEIARIQTPVVQEKTGDLRNHSIDDDAMIGMYDGLAQKNPELFKFKTEEGRGTHEQSKQMVQEGGIK